jgi:NAD(P)-dependent dehydrogenase (short-subunit alcohol dehydrogenase family)
MHSDNLHCGQVALISGGLGDIGFATASLLAARGATLALCDLLPEQAAEDKMAPLRAKGARVDYSRVDVADATAVSDWVRAVAARLGPPSLIIPNAAITGYCATLTTTSEDFERHLKVNLLGAFFMAQEAARILIAHKKAGRIVFIGSWVAHAPSPQILPYATSKAALRMVMKCMALELARHDILVNEVAPGFVDAGLTAKEFEQIPGSREDCRSRVPTGRLLSAADVAKKVGLLCHPDASEITGACWVVDSGLSLVTPADLPLPTAELPYQSPTLPSR